MRLSRLLVLTCQQAGCRHADVEVGGGTLDVQVKYLGFKVYSSSGDLCEGLPCPLPAGPQTLTFKQQLPKVAPPVRFTGRCLHRRCCYPLCYPLLFPAPACGSSCTANGQPACFSIRILLNQRLPIPPQPCTPSLPADVAVVSLF